MVDRTVIRCSIPDCPWGYKIKSFDEMDDCYEAYRFHCIEGHGVDARPSVPPKLVPVRNTPTHTFYVTPPACRRGGLQPLPAVFLLSPVLAGGGFAFPFSQRYFPKSADGPAKYASCRNERRSLM